MRRCPTVSVVELREVSTSSACEVTSTTSLPPATESVTGSSVIPPTVMATSAASLCEADASTVTEYVPGAN